MPLPLSGKRILITRPVDQAEEQMQLVRELGGEPLLLPLLDIQPPDNTQALSSAAAALSSHAFAIFISPNAVQFAVPTLLAQAPWPASTTAVAVGKSTAQALRTAGIHQVLCPTERFDSDGVLALPELQQVSGKHIFIFRGQDGRPTLGDTLTARGANVTYITCYKRTPPYDLAARLVSLMAANPPDAILVTSSEAARYLLTTGGETLKKRLQSVPVATSQPRIADTLHKLGAFVAVSAASDDKSLLLTLADVLKSPPSIRHITETAMSDYQSQPPATPSNQTSARLGDKLVDKLNPTLIVALVALGVIAWQWADNRKQLTQAQLEVGKKLAQTEAFLRESRVELDKLDRDRQNERVRLAVVESRLAEAQSQQNTLNTLYQDLSQHRDNLLLAEIEQLLMAASQQIQIASNPRAALVALEGAQSRLTGFDSLRFIPLRQALTKDIEALKALPDIDSEGMTLKLDNLLANVDSLPFVIDAKPQTKAVITPDAPAADTPWYKNMGGEIWSELKQLIRIRRIDKPDAPLLPAEQTYFIRENIKLRLIAARTALLQRDQNSFRTDLGAARIIMSNYFDRQAGEVANAIQTLNRLSATDIHVTLPDLAQSLTALSNLKAAQNEVAATPVAGGKVQ